MNFNNIDKDKKISIILSIFMASALIFGPLVIGGNAFAATNKVNQGISQQNTNQQTSQCAGGNNNCGNSNTQANANSGSNTAGQTAVGGTK